MVPSLTKTTATLSDKALDIYHVVIPSEAFRDMQIDEYYFDMMNSEAIELINQNHGEDLRLDYSAGPSSALVKMPIDVLASHLTSSSIRFSSYEKSEDYMGTALSLEEYGERIDTLESSIIMQQSSDEMSGPMDSIIPFPEDSTETVELDLDLDLQANLDDLNRARVSLSGKLIVSLDNHQLKGFECQEKTRLRITI
jgi:hypothetical protein